MCELASVRITDQALSLYVAEWVWQEEYEKVWEIRELYYMTREG